MGDGGPSARQSDDASGPAPAATPKLNARAALKFGGEMNQTWAMAE
jgi:hypothetical protein